MNITQRTCQWLMAATVLCVPACTALPNGHFSLFGYSTQPNYDTSIRTVFVPQFKNESFYKGLEVDLTRAIVREIEAKTPYRIVSCREDADTELTGKVINLTKSMLLSNQLNEIRQGQTILSVELVWQDLRPGNGGKVLSQPGSARPPDPFAPPPDPNAPPPPPVPMLLQATGSFEPELGGSLNASQIQLIDRLAVQIVSMMEIWDNTSGCVPITPP